MSQLTLIHSESFPIDEIKEYLDRRRIEAIPANEAEPGIGPALVILDDSLQEVGASFPRPSIAIRVGGDGQQPAGAELFATLPEEAESGVLRATIDGAVTLLKERERSEELERRLQERTSEIREINQIGMALSTERDHGALIEKILKKTRELTRSDAGSLYLLGRNEQGEGILRWKVAQNDSISVDFTEQILPITKKSLAGYVAQTGETLVIDDAYHLEEGVEYSINRSFDEATGYKTKSMLIVPMKNHKGEMIGILQLINRRRKGSGGPLSKDNVDEEVIPFDKHTISVAQSLAGQAAVAVDNNLLYDSIEKLFEGFVTASVTAIEQRDPTTSGHSGRVAALTVDIADVMNKLDTGPFREVRFTPEQVKEIRYASLLHDFGKVGVREEVLVKQKKLYPMQFQLVKSRFEYLMKAREAELMRKRFEEAMQEGPEAVDEFWKGLDDELKAELDRIEEQWNLVAASNEPTVLPEGNFEGLQELSKVRYVDPAGSERELLSPEEVEILSIRKGSLDPEERKEIESHVTHTFHFLSKIPWTNELRKVPDYAYAHHEKLNGRGYPRGLTAEEIPIQSRMMTVSDIYDALTAKDRPYKKAVPTDRALDILNMEKSDGLLDSEIVDLFIDAKVYETGVVRE
ncbi:MAG: HD domain-containing phosphohydrolase [Thermoanaerobaculia bacterium]|nr:HD domain-containing phosphohydrolase [Thermoanaerobaculia bacterium]